MLGRRRRQLAPVGDAEGAHLYAYNMAVGFLAYVTGCAIFWLIHLSGTTIKGNLLFADNYVCREPTGWALEMWSVTVAQIVTFRRTLFTGGIAMPRLTCAEVQVEGCVIGPSGPGSTRQNYAIWASDCEIARRLHFGVARDGDRLTRNLIVGQVDLSQARIGERLWLRSADIFLAHGSKRAREPVAVDLQRVRIEGDLSLAPYGHTLLERRETDEEPARIEGCVAVDQAEIGATCWCT